MANDESRVEEIFFQALQKVSTAELAAYLDETCQDDDDLRQRVQQLLDAEPKLGSFLQPHSGGMGATIDRPISEGPGSHIGPYRLLQQIGEGGMGIVYMAEQKEPVKRRVALKIIRPGMDTRQVIARFEAERQALAMMEHPNIANVLDAGQTDSGRPYFIMELVKGVPVTQYCDEQHLNPKERLELYIPICQAVQHAHQKGIIHRDIKPSNILVALFDGQPIPKVIDFGVAKATSQTLTEKTMFTQLGQVVGTLEYMSPEQAQVNQLDVDTRSDIYSLGVLLYELLTGCTPFDRQRLRSVAFEEMLRIIREEEPLKPSTKLSSSETLPSIAAKRHVDPQRLTSLVRGELDWIVMKALEKDRGRRYASAETLADDVKRYLSNEAVVACPPSAAYRFRKFARRNKAPLATAALVATALVVGLIGTAWQAVRAMQAENVARDQRDTAVEAKHLADDRLERALSAEQEARESKLVEVKLRQDAERHSSEVTSMLAASQADHAQALCEQGEIGRGMLWLAHSLRSAPEEAAALRRSVRANLTAWASYLHSLRAVAWMDSEVTAVAISADGGWFVTGCADGMVRLWDADNGELIRETRGHNSTVQAVAISPDGSRVASAIGGQGATVRLWGAPSLTPIGEPWHGSRLLFSPNGSRLWSCHWGVVRVHDPATGEMVERRDVAPDAALRNIRCLAWTSSGPRAVVTIDRGLHQLWDVDRENAVGPPVRHPSTVAAAAHPDGTRFATAGYQSPIRLWDAPTGELAMSLNHGGTIHCVDFSADGTRLVSGAYDRAARFWNAETGQPIGIPMRHRGTVLQAVISRDGHQILTGSEDATARLWRVASGNPSGQPIQHADRVVGAAFSTAGLRIVTERDGLWQFRDADSGAAISEPFPPTGGQDVLPTFSPDGSLVLMKNWFRTELREVKSGQNLLSMGSFKAAFSPDGSRILGGRTRPDNNAICMDVVSKKLIGNTDRHPREVLKAVFSSDGSLIVTGCYDGKIRFWDVDTMQPLAAPMAYPSEVKALAISPDDSLILAGYADWTAQMWDASTGEAVGLPLHHQHIVCSAAFSPDGSRMATCDLGGRARLWDTAIHKAIGPTLSHAGFWADVTFSPDASQLLIADDRGACRIWPTPKGPLKGTAEQIACWAQVITGLQLGDDGAIGVLDGPAWQERRQQLLTLGGSPAPADLPGRIQRPASDFFRTLQLAWAARGRALQGDWDAAEADFTRAIERSGNSPTLRRQIAYWCQQLATEARESEPAAEELADKANAFATVLADGLKLRTPQGVTLAKLDDILDGSPGNGWIRLFDGETLSEWTPNENADTWKVDGDAIVGAGRRSHLFYEGEGLPLTNFELVCEVMTFEGANSGLYFHTRFQRRGFPRQGYEVQICGRTIADSGKTGSLWGVVNVPDPPCQDNEYFTMHVIVRGKRVLIAVNEEVVVDYTEPENDRRLSGGTFALQLMRGKVQIKNLFIKRLP